MECVDIFLFHRHIFKICRLHRHKCNVYRKSDFFITLCAICIKKQHFVNICFLQNICAKHIQYILTAVIPASAGIQSKWWSRMAVFCNKFSIHVAWISADAGMTSHITYNAPANACCNSDFFSSSSNSTLCC